MAEGWARQLLAGSIEPFSAGTYKHGVDRRAIRVMQEAGVDISGQESKTVEELPHREFDAVVTLCDAANKSCPFFPGKFIRLHQGFDDPPRLADSLAEEQAMQIYRRVRDEIRDFVLELPHRLQA